jgi:flagellar biosynthesis protein FliQ
LVALLAIRIICIAQIETALNEEIFKFLKKLLLTILSVIIVLILLRGYIYRHSFNYKTIVERFFVDPTINDYFQFYYVEGK